MEHVKDKKYTYFASLFLGTVVQQMIQRFLESLACILKSPINECQWPGFYSTESLVNLSPGDRPQYSNNHQVFSQRTYL